MTSSYQWKGYGIKNVRLDDDLWYQGVCMHIDDQAWVVHLIVYGTDTWGVNSYAKWCLSAKVTLILIIQQKKHIWKWNSYIIFPDNSKVAEIHDVMFSYAHVCNSDLIVLKHWHSCDFFKGNAFFSTVNHFIWTVYIQVTAFLDSNSEKKINVSARDVGKQIMPILFSNHILLLVIIMFRLHQNWQISILNVWFWTLW